MQPSENRPMQIVENRPFLGYWKHFKEFDKQRSSQQI
jgi:hypothetical protein